MRDMAGEITRITAERVQAELDKLMLGAAPWTGINLMVTTGIADYHFPEIPGMKLTQDEHMQHKDVYAHSMQVLRQAMDQEEDGPTWCCAGRRYCTTSVSLPLAPQSLVVA